MHVVEWPGVRRHRPQSQPVSSIPGCQGWHEAAGRGDVGGRGDACAASDEERAAGVSKASLLCVEGIGQPYLGLLLRRATLVHDRVEGTPPVLVRVVHHDIDEDGHGEGEDRRAVAHLVPVDMAVPVRAAVDELVTKDVEPVEDEAKDADGVPLLEGPPEATPRRPKPILPVLNPRHPVVVLPEGGEHVLVLEEHPDGPGEVVPDRVEDPLAGIEGHDLLEEFLEGVPLRGRRVLNLLLKRTDRLGKLARDGLDMLLQSDYRRIPLMCKGARDRNFTWTRTPI